MQKDAKQVAKQAAHPVRGLGALFGAVLAFIALLAGITALVYVLGS